MSKEQLRKEQVERLKLLKSLTEAERIILRGTRVTIPRRFRDALGLKDKSVLECRVQDNKIILRLVKA